MRIKIVALVRNQNPKNTHKPELREKRDLPDFSYSRLEIKEHAWELPGTRINLSLTDLPKEKTPVMAYQKRFNEVVDNEYKG